MRDRPGFVRVCKMPLLQQPNCQRPGAIGFLGGKLKRNFLSGPRARSRRSNVCEQRRNPCLKKLKSATGHARSVAAPELQSFRGETANLTRSPPDVKGKETRGPQSLFPSRRARNSPTQLNQYGGSDPRVRDKIPAAFPASCRPNLQKILTERRGAARGCKTRSQAAGALRAGRCRPASFGRRDRSDPFVARRLPTVAKRRPETGHRHGRQSPANDRWCASSARRTRRRRNKKASHAVSRVRRRFL